MQSVRSLRRAAIGSALFWFAPLVTAQITVGPPGSGANYSQISAAVAAAPVGARIFVNGGTYDPFVVTQSVSIIRVGTAPCVIAIPPAATASAIEVAQLPASGLVRISGLSLDALTSSPAPRIHLHQCDGRIELLGVVSNSLYWVGGANVDEPALLIEDCDAVQLESCVLHGTHPPTTTLWQTASSGLELYNSRVWCNACSFRGGLGGEGLGADAIYVRDGSFLHLSRTEAIGGGGGAHFGFYWWDIYGYSGEEGVDLENSEVVIAGGPDNLCEGGPGVLLSSIDWTAGGSAVRVRSGGTVRYASDVTLVAGVDGTGLVTSPLVAVQPGGLQVAEPGIRATLGVYPSTPQPGQVIAIHSAGDALATHAVFATFAGVAPGLLGNGQYLHVNPANATLVAWTTLAANGVGSLAVPLPAIPALSGTELVLQGVDVDLSILRLTNPALMTIRL